MNRSKNAVQTPGKCHNHKVCVATALNRAETHCRRQGLLLTDLRRQVLKLVWNSHRPVGAYQLLEQISQDGRKAAPPTVYRCLAFLLQHRLIHRIASLNAYVGCNQPGRDHDAQFFICSQCGEAAELADTRIDNALARDARTIGFVIEKRTVEVSGTCSDCRKRKPQ
jgi:Fur family zinc uptake transcriptional regulator